MKKQGFHYVLKPVWCLLKLLLVSTELDSDNLRGNRLWLWRGRIHGLFIPGVAGNILAVVTGEGSGVG